MIKINTSLAAVVAAGVLATLLTACGGQSVEETPPIEPAPTSETQYHGPIEEEYGGDSNPDAEDPSNKIAVAGKEAITYEDGLSVTIGNIRKAKVPQGYDHPGEPAVRFDVRVSNGTELRMDASSVSVALSYGPDGRNATSLLSDGDEYGFSGVIPKGKAKTVGYTFEVPARHMDDMLIEVSPDYDRNPALFSASV